MGNADDHYLSHLEQAKYMPKPYGLVSGITKVLLKITSAKLFLVSIRLHVDNWECRAQNSPVRCQKFGVPCRFFVCVNGV